MMTQTRYKVAHNIIVATGNSNDKRRAFLQAAEFLAEQIPDGSTITSIAIEDNWLEPCTQITLSAHIITSEVLC